MRVFSISMTVLLALTAVGRAQELPPVAPGDWSMYNLNVLGWRYNSAEKSLSPANAGKLEEKWRFPRKDSKEFVGAIHATPIVVNGHVYFGTMVKPAFYKLKPNGEVAWKFRIPAYSNKGALGEKANGASTASTPAPES